MEEKQSGKAAGRIAAFLRRSWLLLLGGALGIALLVWGTDGTENRQAEMSAAPTEEEMLAACAVAWEAEIKTLCAAVQGVGDVHVVVTLEGDFSRVYAVNHTEIRSGDRTQVSDEYVTVGTGSSENALLLGYNTPAVSGIGIVCRGGNDADVRREILSLLTAVFGIGANRIYITAGD